MHKKQRVIVKGSHMVRKQDIMVETVTKSYDELLRESKQYILENDGNNIDMEIVAAYQERLDELEPNVQEYNQKEEWLRLNARLAREENRREKPKNPRRTLHLCEILVAAVLLLTVLTSAFNPNFFAAITDWVNKTIVFRASPSGEMTLPADVVDEYDSLFDALNAYGAVRGICPTWIPEEYQIESVDVTSDEKFTRIAAYYISGEKVLSFRATWSAVADAAKTEEFDTMGELYTIDGTDFYLLQNSDHMKAVWITGAYYCTISGALTDREFKKIIESIE